MFGRDQILIGLSPTCLRVATLKGGRVEKLNTTSLEPGAWEESWEQGLKPWDAALQAAIKDLKIRAGTSVRVVYFSQKATAEVYSPPVRGAAALQAAQFSLNESLASRSGQPWPTSLNTLLADPASALSPKTHVLGLVDSPAGTEALAAWIIRAGLTVGELIPAKGGALAQAVRVTTDLPATGTHALLWVDDHVTVLAGWSEGRLIFARSLDFGYWMLAEAMMRGARIGEQRGITQQLAYETLFAAGVPQRQGGASSIAEGGVNIDGVLPLMQPVLQRYVIETRQTLRFSVPESEQSKIKVILAGPGATIPNLTTALESHFDSGIEVHGDDADLGVTAQQAGELASVCGPNSVCGILPPSESDRRMHKRLNAALRVGACVATLALLAHGGWTYNRASQVRDQVEQLQQRAQAMADHEVLVARAQKLSADINAATRTIKDTLGERPRWIAGLAMVSRDCGELIELNHIGGSYPPEEAKTPVMTLSGTAYPGKGRGDSLTEFVTRLSKNPVVSNVRIVSTHAADISGVEAKTFIVSVHLRAIDADAGLLNLLDSGRTEDIANVEEKP